MSRKLAVVPLLILLVQTDAAHAADAARIAQVDEAAFSMAARLARSSKGDFDKSTDFDKKRCAELTSALHISPGTSVLFQDVTGIRHWYDADRERFVFENASSAGSPIGRAFYVVLKSHEIPQPSYTGTNAYGVSKRVQVSETEYLALRVPTPAIAAGISATLKAKPEQARTLANDLRLEIVTRLRESCLSYNRNREDPTVSSPIKTTSHIYELNAEPGSTSWRIVQISTGKTLSSGKPFEIR